MCVHDGGVDRKGLAPFMPSVLSRPLCPVGYPALTAVARLLCPVVIAVAGFSTGKSTGYSSRGWLIDRWRVRSLSCRCALRKPRCPLMFCPCVAIVGYPSGVTFSTGAPLFPKGNLVGELMAGRMKSGASRWVGHPSPSSMLFSTVLVGERGLRGRSLLVPVGPAVDCHGRRVYTSVVRISTCSSRVPCASGRLFCASWTPCLVVLGLRATLKRNDSRQRISRLSLR